MFEWQVPADLRTKTVPFIYYLLVVLNEPCVLSRIPAAITALKRVLLAVVKPRRANSLFFIRITSATVKLYSRAIQAQPAVDRTIVQHVVDTRTQVQGNSLSY